MKRLFCIIFYIVLVLSFSWSQSSNSMLDTFLTNFNKGGPDVKLQVLKDAAELELPGMGPLYLEGVYFVINNAPLINQESIYRKISLFSVTQIKRTKYASAAGAIWDLFIIDKNTEVRIDILETLSESAVGDEKIIGYINRWLEGENSSFALAKTPDLPVIKACVTTLGILGAPSSFPILFRALTIKYSEEVRLATDDALAKIKGDHKQLYTSVIRKGAFTEKRLALQKTIASETFNDTDKCEIVEFALNTGLNSSANSTDEKILVREIRGTSVDYLSSKGWSNATELLINHLNMAIYEFDRNIVSKSYLVAAIYALGKMKTHEAAKRLNLYLELINSFTESGRAFDEQIVLNLIASLKELGDNVATGALLYTKYLNYSDTVKKAAADAIKSLK